IFKEQQKIVSRIGIIEVQLHTLLNHTKVNAVNLNGFDLPFVDNAENLEKIRNKMEKDLDEEEYFKRVVTLMKQKIIDKDDIQQIVSNPRCTFRQGFLSKVHVDRLFKCVGSTNLVMASDEKVKDFFMKRLKHALERSKAKGLRKSTSRKRKLV
uniref:DUF4806 domain-containing protein n=1 Tax=Anopheles funestus TaxID=62324 RepID=A0A182S062_ANOFN